MYYKIEETKTIVSLSNVKVISIQEKTSLRCQIRFYICIEYMNSSCVHIDHLTEEDANKIFNKISKSLLTIN